MRLVLSLLSAGLLALGASACHVDQNLDWWKTATIYQIYPRSFMDSNNDGIGDLKGITSRLQHIKDTGADALWLSPIYSSPNKDFGYDISNFTNIAPEYGTLKDFDDLVAAAKKLGLRVMLDFVPNHSSHEHPWFQKSIDRVQPYSDYYIWRDGKKLANGTLVPPTNWLSAFGHSAWEWNEKRKQYYYHAFVAGQPDLNYRNTKLQQEMKDVLTFWMKRGVDGYRVDAINHMFETEKLQDEPRSNRPGVPPEDYDYLDHIYTRDLNETYAVVGSWQKLLDEFVAQQRSDAKLMILEAYTTIPRSMRYYEVGANPFNFMFIANLNNESRALDFKRTIDEWLNAVPAGKVANWVVGNHDNHRVATRYGDRREDQISMLAAVLPGIAVIYNGDEIGMVDRPFTYNETVDPAGCQAGPERYHLKSRDPERTPFQWDDTAPSAGFSKNASTWLPVHDNYKTLNLAAQVKAENSHFKVFQALAKLRKSPVLQKGKVEVLLATENVLAVVRRLDGQQPVALLVNFANSDVELDARTWINVPEKGEVVTASLKSGIKAGQQVDATKLKIPGAASVIIRGK